MSHSGRCKSTVVLLLAAVILTGIEHLNAFYTSRHRLTLARNPRVLGKYTTLQEQKKSENIDLFAAGDIKSPKTSSSVSTTERTSPNPYASDESIGLRGVSKQGSFGGQAEQLRLEAERESIEFELQRLEDEKDRLKAVDDFIMRLLLGADVYQTISENRRLLSKEVNFRFMELANAAVDMEERTRIIELNDQVMNIVKELDPALHEEIVTDVSKELKADYNKMKASSKDSNGEPMKFEKVLEQWVAQTMKKDNVSMNGDGDSNRSPTFETDENGRPVMMPPPMVRLPTCVPIIMLPMILRGSEINQADVEMVNRAVFNEDILENCTCDGSGILLSFTGKPTVSAMDTYKTAMKRIEAIPGLSERIRVFALPSYPAPGGGTNAPSFIIGTGADPMNPQINPREPSGSKEDRLVQEQFSGDKFEPVFVVTSKTAMPRDQGTVEFGVAAVGLLSSFVTSFIYATDVNSMNMNFLQLALDGDDSIVGRVLPIAAGVMALGIVHDAGHFIAAAINKVKISLPSYFFPSLQIGHFGTITTLLSYPKNRKEFFDVSIAGPLLGFIVSFALTVYGLMLTQSATPEVASTFPALPERLFSQSLLLHEMLEAFHITAQTVTNNAASVFPGAGAGTQAIDPLAQLAPPAGASLVSVHPYVATGLTGLIMNAYNFMPVGRLDGGRVAMSIFGRRTAAQIGAVTVAGLVFSFFSNEPTSLFFWSLVVLFLQRGPDIPPEDDISPIATLAEAGEEPVQWVGRLVGFAICAALTAGILLPIPGLDADAVGSAVTATQGLGAGLGGGDPNGVINSLNSVRQGFDI